MDRRKFLKNTISSSIAVTTTSGIALSNDLNAKEQSEFMTSKNKEPLVRVVDLDMGEETEIKLHDGSMAKVKLLGVEERREPVFETLKEAVVQIEINGEHAELISSSYRLPVTIGGVQVDVPAVGAYMKDTSVDWWRLKKAARIRLWPAGSAWIRKGSFRYPVKQRWFASTTWYSNEAVSPATPGKVYYHAGMDFGGTEGLTEIVAATDGIVMVLGDQSLEDNPKHTPVISRARYDVVYIQDKRGWIYRYSHMQAIDPSLQLGTKIKMGQRLGYIGKEGGSGGWTHLHFHIESLQPSGELGIEDCYAFLWQAYREEYDPQLLAVARPHLKALPGEEVTLDASRSWAKNGIRSFDWTFSDGTGSTGAKVNRIYDQPGRYSEVVKVTDQTGNIEYDFVWVDVYPGAQKYTVDVVAHSIPRVHAVHHPTNGIKAGDPVIFTSRGFQAQPLGGKDIYDFGDGSPEVSVPSNIDNDKHAANGYGMVVHHFKEPGHYIVKVERKDEETGYVAMHHLHVVVVP
ncbi:MAG: PKD domain-containing protein [Bacteroidota bacterium]